MRGLRTQESVKFNQFWSLIQDQAQRQGMVFFGDCGEGRGLETDTMEGEDFCGWLVPEAQAGQFEPVWKDDAVSDEWTEHIVFAEWKEQEDKITIEFKRY